MTPEPDQPEMTPVHFTLGSGALGMNISVQAPAGVVTITQMLPVLQEITNDIVGGVATMFNEGGQPISCKAGCGACCRQLVPINLFEAEALAAWIRSLPQERQDELLARFSAAMQQLQERGILAGMGEKMWTSTKEENVKFMTEYLKARVACPFLENESCSIHPIRPLICREYLVTSPPEYCYIPVPEKVVRIDIPVKPSNGVFRMASRIERNGRGWIPLIFLGDWMKGRGTPGEAYTGNGPELLYEFLGHLSREANESAEADEASRNT